MMNYFG